LDARASSSMLDRSQIGDETLVAREVDHESAAIQ
jgi:hypothetical protein